MITFLLLMKYISISIASRRQMKKSGWIPSEKFMMITFIAKYKK